MIGRTLDWIGFNLLARDAIGHVMWGAGLGVLSWAVTEPSRDRFVIAGLLLIGGMSGMIGHYVYRAKVKP